MRLKVSCCVLMQKLVPLMSGLILITVTGPVSLV